MCPTNENLRMRTSVQGRGLGAFGETERFSQCAQVHICPMPGVENKRLDHVQVESNFLMMAPDDTERAAELLAEAGPPKGEPDSNIGFMAVADSGLVERRRVLGAGEEINNYS